MKTSLLSLLLLAAFAPVAANAAILWDQIGAVPTTVNGFASQTFEPANSAFNITAIDNFTTTQAATLTSAEAVVFGYNQPAGVTFNPNLVTSWQVAIFSNAAGTTTASQTGNVFNVVNVPMTFTTVGTRFLVSLNLAAANFTLPAGTYWMGVTGTMSFAQSGQLAVGDSTLVDGTPNDARQINPGNGFGSGTNFPITSTPANLAYRLNGTFDPVPEPASLAVLGLGAAALLRRRRRA